MEVYLVALPFLAMVAAAHRKVQGCNLTLVKVRGKVKRI